MRILEVRNDTVRQEEALMKEAATWLERKKETDSQSGWVPVSMCLILLCGRDYSLPMSSSIILMAEYGTGVPGPKMAATPAL